MNGREAKNNPASEPKREFLLLVFALCNAAAGAVALLLLPDKIAVHFNAAFEADKLGSKWTYIPLFLIPPVIAAMYPFERRRQPRKNLKPLSVTLTTATAFLIYAGWVTVLWCGSVSEAGKRAQAPVYMLINAPLGIVFLLLGNYLPVIRRNARLGIRTPATLSSDYVWTHTHRVMGKVWVAMGGGEIVCAFVDTFAGTDFLSCGWLLVAVAAHLVLLPLVTARFKRREEEQKRETDEGGFNNEK